VWPLPCFKLCHRAACATLRPVPRCNRRPEPCCGRCHVAAGARTLLCGVETEVLAEAQSRLGFSSGNRTLHMQPVTVLSHDFAFLPGTARCTHSRSMHSHEFVCFRESQAAHAASHHVQSRWRNRFGRILYRCDNHGLCHIAAGATLQTQAGATRQTVAENRCRELFPRAQFKNCACNTRPWIRACPWDTALVHLGCRPGRTVSQHIELTCKASLSHMLEPTP
jgi:hypothetical protein